MYETTFNPKIEKYKLLRLKKTDILKIFSIFHESYPLNIDDVSFCVQMSIKTSTGEHRGIRKKEEIEKILNEHNDVKAISIFVLMYSRNAKEKMLTEKIPAIATCIGTLELNQTDAKLSITSKNHETLAAGVQSRINELLENRKSYLNFFFGWYAVGFICVLIILIEYFFLLYKQLYGVESIILQIALMGFLEIYFSWLKNKIYREIHVRFDSPENDNQIKESIKWLSTEIKANLVPFLTGMISGILSTIIGAYFAYKMKWL